MTDHAATLTYFAMMSLFPALLLGVTLLGLFGQQGLVTGRDELPRSTTAPTRTPPPSSARSSTTWSTRRAARSGSRWSSRSSWRSTARRARSARPGRALNVVYGVDEDRGFVRRKLTDLAATLVVIVLLVVVLVAVFLGGQIADDLFGKIGLGARPRRSGRSCAGRWPWSRRASPTGSSTRSRPTSSRAGSAGSRPGALVGVVLWIVLSLVLRRLHPELLDLRRGVRRVRRGDRAAAVAVPLGQRVPVRRRAQRRARARRPRGSGQLAVGELRRVGAQGRPPRARRRTGPRCGTSATGYSPASRGAAAWRSSLSSVRASARS